MTLGTGSRIGRYEILGRVGAGGMGEVYRARDERLDRDVAIKVLPDAVAEDPERLARFEREAKLLASLNHPNSCHLYGLESSPVIPSERNITAPPVIPSERRSRESRGLGGRALEQGDPRPDPSIRSPGKGSLTRDDRAAVTFLALSSMPFQGNGWLITGFE